MSKLFKRVAVGAGVLVAAVPAFADVPAAATQAFASTATDGAAMVALGWGLFAGITGGLTLIKIGKKSLSKAT